MSSIGYDGSMSGPVNITKEQVAALPIGRFEGEIRLVTGAVELERALADLRRERVLGFDTETRPAFRPGESYLPALVQLAGARAVYVFQLKRHDFSAAIGELLSAQPIVKAGVSVADDLKKLKQLMPFEEKSVVDLGTVAKRAGIKQSGVRNLAAMFLGLRIPKGKKTSNWAALHLSPAQIGYAATDAWACRELYLDFEKKGWLHHSVEAGGPAAR
jgi:ribonuclease D